MWPAAPRTSRTGTRRPAESSIRHSGMAPSSGNCGVLSPPPTVKLRLRLHQGFDGSHGSHRSRSRTFRTHHVRSLLGARPFASVNHRSVGSRGNVDAMDQKPPTPAIESAHRSIWALPFDDTDRLRRRRPGIHRRAGTVRRQGRRRQVVWDNDVYAFLTATRRHRCTPVCGGSPALPPSKGSTRWSRASTRCAVSTCRTSPSSRATPA